MQSNYPSTASMAWWSMTFTFLQNFDGMEMQAKNKSDTTVLMMTNSHISELYSQMER